MKVTAIKTHKITAEDKDILKVLDKYLEDLKENSVVAITSKIMAICEGSMIKINETDKEKLIASESQKLISAKKNKYNITLTIKDNLLMPGAGIDESNGNGYFILLPKDPQKSANQIREFLKTKFKVSCIGVIITDSRSTPLRWGVTGFAIAFCGFKALKDYVGSEDLFGRKFLYEKLNISDSLASTAVLTMGEGSEQTPIAVIEDVPFLEYQDRSPTQKELDQLKIDFKDDIYESLLANAPWEKGDG